MTTATTATTATKYPPLPACIKKNEGRNKDHTYFIKSLLTDNDKFYIEKVFNIVEQHFGLPKNSVLHQRNIPKMRGKPLESYIRHIAWVGCLQIFKIEKQFYLAKYTGEFNHAAVYYAQRKIIGNLKIPYLEKEIKPVLTKIIEFYNTVAKMQKIINHDITYEIWREQILTNKKFINV